MLPNQGVGHSGWRRSPMAGSRFSPTSRRAYAAAMRPAVLRLPLAAPPGQAGVIGQPEQIFRLESRRVEVDLLDGIAGQRQNGAMVAHRIRLPRLPPPFVQQGRGRENPLSEVGVDAQVPGAARFIVGLGAGAVHRAGGAPGGLGVARAPVALIEDVIHAAGQTDVFGDVPGRAQAEDAVGANLVLLAAGDRLTLVVVLLRLLLAVR